VPIFIALARFLQTKNKVYELTTERLKITEGIFNKVTDTLELYGLRTWKHGNHFGRGCAVWKCAGQHV
jgi:hypothetical protein